MIARSSPLSWIRKLRCSAENPGQSPIEKYPVGVCPGFLAVRRACRSSVNSNPPWHSFARFLECQRQDAILDLRGNLLLIDLAGQRERPREMPDIVLGV